MSAILYNCIWGLKGKAANMALYLLTNDNGVCLVVKRVVMRMRLGGCVDNCFEEVNS